MPLFRFPGPAGHTPGKLNCGTGKPGPLGLYHDGSSFRGTSTGYSSDPVTPSPDERERKRWRLHARYGVIELALRADLQLNELHTTDPSFFLPNFDQWFAGRESRRMMYEMCELVFGHSGAGGAGENAARNLRLQLEDAFRRGELAVLLRRVISGGAEGAEASRRTPIRRRPQKVKTWVEIELIDDGGAPVTGERYRIQLSDGSTLDGTLDDQGRARVDDIDPGTCRVSFPDLDAKEWRAA